MLLLAARPLLRYFTEDNRPVTVAGRGPGVRAGAGYLQVGVRAEIGTVQGCNRFVNLSIEGLITLAPISCGLGRLAKLPYVRVPARRPSPLAARCALLGVYNPIGVWCNPVIETMSGYY